MRRFELVEGTSSKFWEVETRAAVLVVRYGRIGTEGQTKEKTFASASAAESEAEKLVREKTGKGYAAVGGAKGSPVKGSAKAAAKAAPAKATAKAPAKAAPTKAAAKAPTKAAAKAAPVKAAPVKAAPTKAAPKAAAKTAPAKKAASTKAAPAKAAPAKPAKGARVMPVPGQDDPRPGKFAFTAELDALFARGWPQLRVLTDEEVSPAVACKEAIRTLEAVDPCLPTIVPRDVARRVILGHQHHPFREGDAMRAAVESDRTVDLALLERALSSGGLSNCTYVFHMKDVVFFFEAFLGTEVVAAALVERCRQSLENHKAWGDKFNVDHDNSNRRRIIHALGWLRLRMPPARWKALVAPLKKANPKLPIYSDTLARLADDSLPIGNDEYSAEFAMQRRDAKALRALPRRNPLEWAHAQQVYVLGADYLLEADVKPLARQPKWFQQRFVAELGAIRAPGTVRVIASLLPSRSAGAVASQWLEEHRAWVESEALPVLSKRPADAELVSAVRASFDGAAPPTVASPAALQKELNSMIAAVPRAVLACKGDARKELVVFQAAFARWCEIRAAQGDVIPEAYFTHAFIDAKWGKADKASIKRWIELALDAASP